MIELLEKIKKINILQNTFVLLCLNLVIFSLVVYIKINKQNAIATITRETKQYNLSYEKYISLQTENVFQKNKNNPIKEALALGLHPLGPSDILKNKKNETL